jgi:hypothetical protein
MISSGTRTISLVVAAVICTLVACSDDPESPQAKHEWSILQTVEYSTRAMPISAPEFRTEAEYELMCVRGQSGTRIWIMLKPGAAPYYKQMPAAQFSVSKSLVNKLVLERRVSDTVAHVLRVHEVVP